MSGRIQSIERAVAILMTLAKGPHTLTEVAQETGLSKATAYRILASLTLENMVAREQARGPYMLSFGVLQLTQSLFQGVGTVSVAGRSTLTRLSEKTGETVTIHVRVGFERLCVQEVPSPSALRYVATVGATAPLHTGSAGHVLLSLLDDQELEQTLEHLSLKPIAPGTIKDPESLRERVEKARTERYSMSSGERLKGAAAISVPIQSSRGLTGALSILGPELRLTEETRLGYLPDLWQAAEEIGTALSGTDGSEDGVR